MDETIDHKDGEDESTEDSSRAQERMQKLANDAKEATERAEKAEALAKEKEDQLFSLQNQGEQEKLSDVERLAQGQERLRTDRFLDTLDRDRESLQGKYDVLNPESDNYDEKVAKNIDKMYSQTVGYDNKSGKVRNPIRLKDYADDYFGAVESLVDRRSSESASDAVRQTSQFGARPGGGRKNSLGSLGVGDISNMDSKTYEKNKDAINAEINRQLGI